MKQYSRKISANTSMKRGGYFNENLNQGNIRSGMNTGSRIIKSVPETTTLQGHVRSGMNTRSRIIKSAPATTTLKDNLFKYNKIYFLVSCFIMVAGIYLFVKTEDQLWDKSDIMKQTYETISYSKLIKNRTRYQPKKTANNESNIESFRQLDNDEMPENYTEYKGPLHYGNLIKARLCSELVYLKYLLDITEPAGILEGAYDDMYNVHRPDVDIIKKDKNYEEIKKNVTELVDQIPEGDESGQPPDESGQTVRQKEFIKNINALQDPLKSKCDMNTITKEANHAIDELLDILHHNLSKTKKYVTNAKIWTLQGFFAIIFTMSKQHDLNLKPKVHKILEGIISNEMTKMANTKIQNRVDGIVQWVSLFPTDGWTCFKPTGMAIDKVSTDLVYGEGGSKNNPNKGIQMYPRIQNKLSEDQIGELARPTRKTKREHKEWFVESLSLLLTEGSHLFKTQQLQFQNVLSYCLVLIISNDAELGEVSSPE